MVARGPYYSAKDAWLQQLVGGSTQYGNGTGDLINIGPFPNGTPGNPDIKGRGVFEISAADMAAALADLTSVDDAEIEVTVGPQTCGSRGGTIRLLLEEMTTDFGLKSASGDCGFSSGTGNNVWGISNNTTTLNRAFHSSGAHSTGDKLTFDVAALMEARRAAADFSAFRFRIIAANSGGTAYDEATSARKITVYSEREATESNHANLSLTGTIGSVAKALAETGTGTEGFSVSQAGDAPSFAETGVGVDGFTGGPAATWSTVLDGTGNGIAQIELPDEDMTTLALLDDVAEDDVLVRARFRLDKVPAAGKALFSFIVRALSSNSYYVISATISQTQSMGLRISKVVAGVSTVLVDLTDQRTFIVAENFWLQAQVSGLTPTALLAKFWRAGDTEPGWDVAVQDSEASLQANGTLGVGATLEGVTNVPIIIQFDDYEALPPT